MANCPCGTGKTFQTCCGPLLDGGKADTAESLMRARYTAFARGNLDFIERTCTDNALATFNRADLEASLPETEWTGFDVLETSGGGRDNQDGTVKFSFRYRHGGRDFTQLEIATFLREGDDWRYDASEVNPKPPPVRVDKIGRNDPCPCGSGKKYKKCHGAQDG